MEDRREYPRYSVGDKLYCEMIDAQGTSYYGRIADISMYGAKIEFSKESYPGTVQAGGPVYIYGYKSEKNLEGSKIAAKAVWNDKQSYGIEFYSAAYESAASLMSMYPKVVPLYYS